MIVQEVKARLSNGFTFVIDFTDYRHSAEACSTWDSYYRSIGVIASITITNCKDLENFANYNEQSYNLFSKAFTSLTCNEKISVAELVYEISL